MAEAIKSDISDVYGQPEDFITITFGTVHRTHEIDVWKGTEHDSRKEVMEYIAEEHINGLNGVFGRDGDIDTIEVE
jgi:hypothetical protein